MAVVDSTGQTVKTTDEGLIRIDGITVFRRVVRDGVIFIEFCDSDRMRAKCRGTRFVEVPWSVLSGIIDPIQIPEVKDKVMKALLQSEPEILQSFMKQSNSK
jgi:hypothetical protein